MGHRVRGQRRLPHYIKEWREARGLSLTHMARMVPYGKSSMSRIENGLQDYTQEFLEAYAVVIGCQPGDLINRRPGGVEELWAILGECDEVMLRQLLAITKTLTKKEV